MYTCDSCGKEVHLSVHTKKHKKWTEVCFPDARYLHGKRLCNECWLDTIQRSLS